MSKSRPINALPFKEFMRRKSVLDLYKSLIVQAKRIPDESLKVGLLSQIRSDFQRNKLITDNNTLKSLLAEGKRSLEQLNDMVASVSPPAKNSLRKEKSPNVSAWIDSSTPDDERGRVGTGWPWSQ